MTADELTAAALELVRRSRERQGLPPRVQDEAALDTLAALLTERRQLSSL